jgi:signal transduction histidine kinase/CheY-like chemotaxis protein
MDGGGGDVSLSETVTDLEDRLEVLTGFTGGILFEFDRDGRYLKVWAGEPTLLARPIPELLGRTVTEVLGPEAEMFTSLFKRVADTGVSETFDYTLDVPAGRRTFKCEARAKQVPHGAAPRVLLFVRDVTVETELQAKLVDAERLAAVGLLAASVGHEIRQPLAFATTSAEVLARELATGGSAEANEALSHVRDAIARIREIASSLGVVAADRARESATRDIRRPIEAALDVCASELTERIGVDIDLPDLPAVRGNEAELCQVFTNLLLNAAQAMDPPSRGEHRIRITGEIVRDVVRVTVSDNGAGIAEDLLDRIFDPFFTTKEAGRGTGLGLFVSRRIVEGCGGKLTVASRRGPRPTSGTSFAVELPLADRAPSSSIPNAHVERSRMSILVVDDEPTFLRSLELLLSDIHDVVVCAKSREALALLDADPKRFDAILCDLGMPDVDGAAFHAQAVRLGIGDRFVLMTGSALTSRSEPFLDARTRRTLAKPFLPDELYATLAAIGPARAPV